jgi:rhodanese-related sulfurtransferase
MVMEFTQDGAHPVLPTLHYTHVPGQQVSEVLEQLSDKIITAANLKPAQTKVVVIKKAGRRGRIAGFPSR